MKLENKLTKHEAFFLNETNRILKIIRNDGTKFDIYQTKDSSKNLLILEQEIRMIVTNNLNIPASLYSEYPLPYLTAKILAGMIKDKVLAEPETFIVD